MARLCERPGCSQPAEVIFGIDAERLVVWLEGLDGNVVQRAGVLCRRHADSMVVPVGWMLDDRRTAAPRLFTAAAPTPLRHRPQRRPRPQEPSTVDEPHERAAQLTLDMHDGALHDGEVREGDNGTVAGASAPGPAGPDTETADTETPDTETAAPGAPELLESDAPAPAWQPKFDQSDDLGGLLTARSPLLSRAFRLDPADDASGESPADARDQDADRSGEADT